MTAETRRYTTIAIALHWLIALAIIAMFAIGKYMVGPSDQVWNQFALYQFHKSLGITILVLSVARLVWRFLNPPPPLPYGMAWYERVGSQVSHWAFYGAMIGIPVSGWLMVSASPWNIPTVVWDIIPLPHLPGIPQSEEVEGVFKWTHEVAANLMAALFVLHVAAALKHHIVNRDDVLARMVPFLRPRPPKTGETA